MVTRKESVSLWHPWQEKGGIKHELALWSDFDFSSIEEIISKIGTGRYYAICNDILSPREVPTNLLKHPRSEPYLSRNGHVAALKIRGKRGNGFLIPAIQWNGATDRDTIENIRQIFHIFDMEAITPSSLSEKVLRRTLPDKLFISRPSVALRSKILSNRSVARILKSKYTTSQKGYEYDEVKAYMSVVLEGVPSPFSAPISFYGSKIWQDMEISFVHVKGNAHVDRGIQPLQIEDNGTYRSPLEGEYIDRWMWSNKAMDCIERGYTLDIIEGFSWYTKSNFMSTWADILYRKCEENREQPCYPILKQMTQGLPGRFLKAPEIYTLVSLEEVRAGKFKLEDVIPLPARWTGDESPMSDWFMHVDTESQKAQDSAQLTPIGDYIVSECERKIYHAIRKEEEAGNKVLRIYVDSFTLAEQASTDRVPIGTKPGQFRLTRYTKVTVTENRFYGIEDETGELVAKTPGIGEKQKERFISREYFNSS